MNTITRILIISVLTWGLTPGTDTLSHAAEPSVTSGKASRIVEVAGTACVSGGKSREAAQSEAIAKAKKKGLDYVLSEIKETVPTKKGSRKSDLLKAYEEGTVRVVGEPVEKWIKDPKQGECCRITAKVEVVPQGKEMQSLEPKASPDPGDPLAVNVWTDKKSYKEGEKFKVFIKSNKSFYGTVIYQDAGGQKVQLLPNPYRKDNYFEGEKLYELPSAADNFDLVVTPPLGGEKVTVFASTSPVGELSTEPAGKVYLVTGSQEQIATGTRSIRFTPRSDDAEKQKPAEFFEATAVLSTGKR